MIDQRTIDLPALVGRYTRLHRDGWRLRGRCPLHHGQSDSSLVLWQAEDGSWRWRCWAGCNGGKSGDAIAWVMAVDGVTFVEAVRALGLDRPDRNAARRDPPPLEPPPAPVEPGPAWVAQAEDLARSAAERLWGPEGRAAIAWLYQRGLSGATIRAAGLGYLPGDTRTPRAAWGLEPDPDRPWVWLPRGIVIPWRVAGRVNSIRIRTPEHAAPWGKPWPKYVQVTGGGDAPWGIDRVTADTPVALVEGAFDRLAIEQAAGDLITPVTVGTTGGRKIAYLARLLAAPLVLLCFDRDTGGDGPRQYWRDALHPRARVWLPYWDDPAAMLETSDALVRGWIEEGIRE